MKFILLSDIHGTSKTPVNRKDNIQTTFLNKFRFVLRRAKKIGASILIAGDVFDHPRDWVLLYHFIRLIQCYPMVQIYAIFGQHDMYLRSTGNTSTMLTILGSTKMITILGKNPIIPTIDQGVRLYGVSWGDIIPKHISNDSVNILTIHAPIYTKEIYPRQKGANIREFVKQNNDYDLILVGDVHQKFTYIRGKTIAINTGPMLRLEANEYNMNHHPCFFIYDTDNRSFEEVEIPHESAEKVLDRFQIEYRKETNKMMEQFLHIIKNPINPLERKLTLKEEIVSHIEENKIEDEVKKVIEEVMSENGS